MKRPADDGSMDHEFAPQELKASFRRWGARVRRDRALRAFVFTASLGLVIIATLAIARAILSLEAGLHQELVVAIIMATPILMALVAWIRPVDVRRVVHALDRSHGFADTLLCAYELSRRAPEPADHSLVRRHVFLEAQECAASVDFRQSFRLPVRRLILSPVFGLSCLFLAGLVPVPPGALEPLSAAQSVLLQVDVSVPERATPLTEQERSLIKELREVVRQSREDSTLFSKEEERRLKEMDELLEGLESGTVLARDAGARLLELQSELFALFAASGKPPQKTGSLEQGANRQDRESKVGPTDQGVEEKLAQAARKTLREEGVEVDEKKEPSALLKSLARLAAKLAERDPERAQALLQKFARHLAGTDLTKLLDEKDALSKQLNEIAKDLEKQQLSKKTRRRLQRLKKKLEKRLSRNEARRARAEPGIDSPPSRDAVHLARFHFA